MIRLGFAACVMQIYKKSENRVSGVLGVAKTETQPVDVGASIIPSHKEHKGMPKNHRVQVRAIGPALNRQTTTIGRALAQLIERLF